MIVTDEPDVVEKQLVDVHAFIKLSIILEEIQKLAKKTVEDEWQICMGLHLHLGGRSLSFLDAYANPRMTRLALSESQHIYWILDLDVEVHPIWVMWTR